MYLRQLVAIALIFLAFATTASACDEKAQVPAGHESLSLNLGMAENPPADVFRGPQPYPHCECRMAVATVAAPASEATEPRMTGMAGATCYRASLQVGDAGDRARVKNLSSLRPAASAPVYLLTARLRR